MKSKNPGASIRFIFVPFHSTGAIAVDMEMWRFFSSGSKSVTVFPSSTLPILSVTPASKSIDSTRVVLPSPP